MPNDNGMVWLSVLRPNKWGELTKILSCSLGAGEILLIGPHAPDKISKKNQEVLGNPNYTITDPRTSLQLNAEDLCRRFPKLFPVEEDKAKGAEQETGA